jgi:hypothetical protein
MEVPREQNMHRAARNLLEHSEQLSCLLPGVERGFILNHLMDEQIMNLPREIDVMMTNGKYLLKLENIHST